MQQGVRARLVCRAGVAKARRAAWVGVHPACSLRRSPLAAQCFGAGRTVRLKEVHSESSEMVKVAGMPWNAGVRSHTPTPGQPLRQERLHWRVAASPQNAWMQG